MSDFTVALYTHTHTHSSLSLRTKVFSGVPQVFLNIFDEKGPPLRTLTDT